MKAFAPVVLAAVSVLALAAAPARAQVTVGVHAATTGFGPDLQVKLSDYFSVRGSADWLDFSMSRDYDSVHYDGRMKLGTGGAFVDWHPWANAFFFSGGAYFGDRRVTIAATPASNVTLGGQSFTPSEVGRLNGAIKMASAAPFAGLGVDSNASGVKHGWGFKGVLGVAFSGKPSVSLTSTGGILSGQPLLSQAIAQEQANIANKASFLQYYPVVQAGLTYKF
jgi:hypothetical protein